MSLYYITIIWVLGSFCLGEQVVLSPHPFLPYLLSNLQPQFCTVTANMNHKMSLSVDSVLLYLQSAQISLSEKITLKNIFSNISDYFWDKSTVLPINVEFQSTLTAATIREH